MKVLKGIGNTILFVLTVFILGMALLNFFSAPEGEGLLGYKGYTVLSGSMEPEISAGDYIIVHTVSADEVEKGDVITYQEANDTLVTHRVVDTTEDGWLTKGDANNTQDSHPVTADALVGEVSWVLPMVGRALLLISKPWVVMGLMAILIVWLLVSYYRSGTENPSVQNE